MWNVPFPLGTETTPEVLSSISYPESARATTPVGQLLSECDGNRGSDRLRRLARFLLNTAPASNLQSIVGSPFPLEVDPCAVLLRLRASPAFSPLPPLLLSCSS